MIWYIRDIRYKKLEKNIKLDDKSCKLISKMIQNSQKFEITPNGLKMFVWKKLNVAIMSYSLYITLFLKMQFMLLFSLLIHIFLVITLYFLIFPIKCIICWFSMDYITIQMFHYLFYMLSIRLYQNTGRNCLCRSWKCKSNVT